MISLRKLLVLTLIGCWQFNLVISLSCFICENQVGCNHQTATAVCTPELADQTKQFIGGILYVNSTELNMLVSTTYNCVMYYMYYPERAQSYYYRGCSYSNVPVCRYGPREASFVSSCKLCSTDNCNHQNSAEGLKIRSARTLFAITLLSAAQKFI